MTFLSLCCASTKNYPTEALPIHELKPHNWVLPVVGKYAHGGNGVSKRPKRDSRATSDGELKALFRPARLVILAFARRKSLCMGCMETLSESLTSPAQCYFLAESRSSRSSRFGAFAKRESRPVGPGEGQGSRSGSLLAS